MQEEDNNIPDAQVDIDSDLGEQEIEDLDIQGEQDAVSGFAGEEIHEDVFGTPFNHVYPEGSLAATPGVRDLNTSEEIESALGSADTLWHREQFSAFVQEIDQAHRRVQEIAGQEPSVPRIRVVISEAGDPSITFDARHDAYVINLSEAPLNTGMVWHEAGHELSRYARGQRDPSNLQERREEGRVTVSQVTPIHILSAHEFLTKGEHPFYEGFQFPDNVSQDLGEPRSALFVANIEEALAHKTAESLLGSERYGAAARKTVQTALPKVEAAAEAGDLSEQELFYIATYIPVLNSCGQTETAETLSASIQAMLNKYVGEEYVDYFLNYEEDLTAFYNTLKPKF